MNDVRLSLCMIVRDEQEYLPGCLESIRGLADEIVIVDTGSSDRTPEIAREYGAKGYEFVWTDDFSEARNESLKYATRKSHGYRRLVQGAYARDYLPRQGVRVLWTAITPSEGHRTAYAGRRTRSGTRP